VHNLTVAAIPLAAFTLLHCPGVLASSRFVLHLSLALMRTLTFLMLVFVGQATPLLANTSCPSDASGLIDRRDDRQLSGSQRLADDFAVVRDDDRPRAVVGSSDLITDLVLAGARHGV
jgi:hypothetical protein